MFPVEFDYNILSSLPFPSEERITQVRRILKGLIGRRIVTYFRNHRGVDPIRLAQVMEHLSIQRLEDEQNRIRVVSLLSPSDQGWIIRIHERIFDYLDFVIPSDPEARLGQGTAEERKMLAFSEFFLRHQMEHILYPQQKEREVIQSDADFAMNRREKDPTFYRTLRESLSDEMSGIRGQYYISLMDHAERERSTESVITHILNVFIETAGDMPEVLLREIFPLWDQELRIRVMGECYRRSRNNSFSLTRRASYLRNVFMFFSLLIKKNEKEALEVFHAFKDKWGLVFLFDELDLPEVPKVEEKKNEELFELLKATLLKLPTEEGGIPPTVKPAPTVLRGTPEPAEQPVKSLKDRIEEARNNPAFPRQVIEVIDKNKLNAVGHSGSKYSELIETLLSIPWGKMCKIDVSPKDFEEGLERTHYGLQGPKEIICDFFSNLIWRYRRFDEVDISTWRRTGSAFLFVGPPGVGKTSFAISIAQNLGIPYHKISLGGMRDEADIRGHGFTYEGSKPGAIVQGLIKMGLMNGMFIMDEADKMEKFAIATLLEILDPEQNHLFHDKYTETTVDIDLSNCHFILTANTLETVPPPVINRCEVIFLDRYSIEEKIAIAQRHLIQRVRSKYQIGEEEIFFDPKDEADLFRYLIKSYTYEAGVRELERILRTLFLRIQRKEILGKGETSVRVTREKIKKYLKDPGRPRQINEEDRVGEMLALGVDPERGVGSIIPIQATPILQAKESGESRRVYTSIVHATGNIEKIMDESCKVATTGVFHCAEALKINPDAVGAPVHLHFMGGSTRKDGPSAGGAIALALASLFSDRKLRRDVSMTGEIDTHGRITGIGALAIKLETAFDAGCKTVIIPRENLHGRDGIERLPDALKQEFQILTYEEWEGEHEPFDYGHHMLQVVAVDDLLQAAKIALVSQEELNALERCFDPYASEAAESLSILRKKADRCFLTALVKEPAEIDTEYFQSLLLQVCEEIVLLVPSKVKDAVKARFAGLNHKIRFQDFELGRDRLADVCRESLKNSLDHSSSPICFSVVAPFFFLKREGVSEKVLQSDSPCKGVRIFANNYTVQNVKIKSCKPILSRVYALLGCLDQTVLDRCPFVTRKDGIYVADLSFIPEKYRLDERRAEKILTRCLIHWLSSVESAYSEN